MVEKLQAVIDANRQMQKRARELNIRAGVEVFKVMSRSEWREWLAQRLNGARRGAEISDFSAIYLPELDSTEVEKVLADNPDSLEVDGHILVITYSQYYGVQAKVTEDFARQLKLENITLPGGRTVEICCGSHSATSLPDLVTKLEQARIKRAWSEKRSEVEHTSWIENPEDVFPYLDKLFSAVEVVRTDNGAGELVYGYFSLYSDSDPDFQIRLRESLEEAEKETKIGLERLLKKACKQIMIVPDEAPWKKEGYWGGNSELGDALQNRLSNLLTEYFTGLSPSNLLEKISALKSAAMSAKTEIGGEPADRLCPECSICQAGGEIKK